MCVHIIDVLVYIRNRGKYLGKNIEQLSDLLGTGIVYWNTNLSNKHVYIKKVV